MSSLAFFAIAALLEIAGCFAFWSWLRSGKSGLLAALGVASLVLFAICLTRVDSPYAGRAYAAYGGIYIATSLVWLRVVEGVAPDRFDLLGSAICVGGALLILFAPRG
jgi:small multidrug resistance family-3 protein